MQSNALKFTKKGDFIKIKVVYVEKASARTNLINKVYHESFFNQEESFEDDGFMAENDRIYREMLEPGEKDKIVVSVLDTGIGIKPEDQQTLFQMFVCLKNSRKLNSQGIGLGLYISKHIVEQFNGHIIVKSEYKKGTRFTFSFDLENDNSNQSQASSGMSPNICLRKLDCLNKS